MAAFDKGFYCMFIHSLHFLLIFSHFWSKGLACPEEIDYTYLGDMCQPN